jgi:hypothetical protein
MFHRAQASAVLKPKVTIRTITAKAIKSHISAIQMSILSILIFYLISVGYGFPVRKLTQLGLYLERVFGHSEIEPALAFPRDAIEFREGLNWHQTKISSTALKDSNTAVDHLSGDSLFQQELTDLSIFIVQELVKFIDVMPDPLDLIDLHKTHQKFPIEGDINVLLLVANLYIHHFTQNPIMLFRLNVIRCKIVRSINKSADKVYDRFRKDMQHQSSKSFFHRLQIKIHSMVIGMEFHVVFRLLVFEHLMELWRHDSTQDCHNSGPE